MTEFEIKSYLYRKSLKIKNTDYHLMNFNCNHFNNIVLKKFVKKPIPNFI